MKNLHDALNLTLGKFRNFIALTENAEREMPSSLHITACEMLFFCIS